MQRSTSGDRIVRAVRDVSDGTAGSRLAHLEDLDDVRIADGAPDVRGWVLESTDGRTLGRVEDLLVDTEAMRVRYMEVRLDGRLASADADRHVLVPIGTARLAEDRDGVLLDGDATRLAGVPAYARGMLDHEYEASVLGSFGAGRAAARRRARGDVYDAGDFDERAFLGRRRDGRSSAGFVTRAHTRVHEDRRRGVRPGPPRPDHR